MEEPAGERGIYTRNDLIRFVSKTIKWSTPNKEQHGEKNINRNRCITNVTITEKQAAGAALNSDTQRCGGEAPPLWQQYAADIILAKIFDKYEKIRYLL